MTPILFSLIVLLTCNAVDTYANKAQWTPLFPECYGGDIAEVKVSKQEECLRGCANYAGKRAPCLFVTWGKGRCYYKNGKTSIHSCKGCDGNGYCAPKFTSKWWTPCDPTSQYCSANLVTNAPASKSALTTKATKALTRPRRHCSSGLGESCYGKKYWSCCDPAKLQGKLVCSAKTEKCELSQAATTTTTTTTKVSWHYSGFGMCPGLDKYSKTRMISWTRNGGGYDDSLEVCKKRCLSKSDCKSFTRDSHDGECILYRALPDKQRSGTYTKGWGCFYHGPPIRSGQGLKPSGREYISHNMTAMQSLSSEVAVLITSMGIGMIVCGIGIIAVIVCIIIRNVKRKQNRPTPIPIVNPTPVTVHVVSANNKTAVSPVNVSGPPTIQAVNTRVTTPVQSTSVSDSMPTAVVMDSASAEDMGTLPVVVGKIL